MTDLQLPGIDVNNVPVPKTATGLILGLIVFLFVTVFVYRVTEAKYSWVPGLAFGFVAGALASA